MQKMVTSCYVMWAAGGKQFRLEAASLRQCDTGVTGTESVIHPAQGSLLRDGVERGGQYQNGTAVRREPFVPHFSSWDFVTLPHPCTSLPIAAVKLRARLVYFL